MRTVACIVTTATLLLTMVVACSPLDVIKSAVSSIAPSDSGIAVETQIGDKENDIQLSGIKGTGAITAEDDATVTVNTSTHETLSKIDTAETVIVNERIPIWVWVVMVLLLEAPRTSTMFRGIKAWLARIRQPASRKASRQKSK